MNSISIIVKNSLQILNSLEEISNNIEDIYELLDGNDREKCEKAIVIRCDNSMHVLNSLKDRLNRGISASRDSEIMMNSKPLDTD